MDHQAKSKDGISIEKSQQLITEIEDILDIAEIKERLLQIEACEPLQKSWTKETLVLNLR